ncbi:MAG: prephenate dehydratase domain-containing protein [Clostridiaceae bacterium]|nr:prephenate dehydratase domain-containing protein [Clostridiaceae bacterium]
MDLQEYRNKIDAIDRQLVELFIERMKTSADIADYKSANYLPVLDKGRERELLLKIADLCGEKYENYGVRLYQQILELSKTYQHHRIDGKSDLAEKIRVATEAGMNTQLPEKATVACQGVEGAYSSLACEKLLELPNIMYFNSVDSVFSAVSNGFCRYGVLPVENSTAGSVNKVYDLMKKYNFYIVKCIRLKINHALLAKKGTKLEDVKKIYSHAMALAQSTDFLSSLEGVEAIPCENTAMAAKAVAESNEDGVAALSSIECAELYGLDVLENSVQNREDNYTRFILISKQLEIYPGADRTSLMLTLPHKAGSLNTLLSMFAALNINLLKLESRPLEGSDFEFMFYFDVEGSVYSEKFLQMIDELPYSTQSFVYLGSYSESV